MVRRLTARQRKFAGVYAGNGTEAARLAGYAGGDNALAQMARKVLRNGQVQEIIQAREESETRPLIADRQARQRFWTATMQDDDQEMRARLKASELLGRSEADFTDNLKGDLGWHFDKKQADAILEAARGR